MNSLYRNGAAEVEEEGLKKHLKKKKKKRLHSLH